MSLAWHPTKEGLLAYGTSGGRIGLIETCTKKLPVVFKPNHPRAIYTLTWGPPCQKEGDNSFANTEFALYAMGDNIISLYNPAKAAAGS